MPVEIRIQCYAQSYPTVAVAHTKCESPAVLFDQMCRMIFNDELREIITPE